MWKGRKNERKWHKYITNETKREKKERQNDRKTETEERHIERKRKENNGLTLELIKNVRNTQVLGGNLLQTQRKHRFCVSTYCKRKENISVAWEPIENARKTYLLRRNQLKT